MTDAHEAYLEQAIEEALRGVEAGEGGPFGALVVRDGAVIGRGRNRVTSELDPTAHAEVVAIRDACRQVGHHALHEAVLYASTEPCPMCYAAIFWARIGRVYYAATRSDAADAGFDDEKLYRELDSEHEQRTLKLERILHPRALEPLAAWSALATRIEY